MSLEIYNDMIGKIFSNVINLDNKILYFQFEDDLGYIFYHNQDCYENVYIEDICGDLCDLTNTPIISAELVGGGYFEPESDGGEEYIDWYFYKFSTIKGSVTIRWCGTSNGCYSTAVEFKKIENVLEINDLS